MNDGCEVAAAQTYPRFLGSPTQIGSLLCSKRRLDSIDAQFATPVRSEGFVTASSLPRRYGGQCPRWFGLRLRIKILAEHRILAAVQRDR